MTSLADRIERARAGLVRDLPLADAESVIAALLQTLRTGAPPAEAFALETLRVLRTRALDAIEPDATAADVRAIAGWFADAIELRLGDTNRQLTAMLDAVDDQMILLDASLEARVLLLNRASESAAIGMHGATREQMVGRSTIAGTHSPAYERYVEGLVAHARAGETVGGEFLLPVGDGAIWHEHRFHPVRAEDGSVEAVAVSSREIHARKLAEGRVHLLSKVGLLAESREPDEVLVRAAGLAIPELADWSVFETVADGGIERSTVVHPEIAKRVDAERFLTTTRDARRLPGIGGAQLVDMRDAAAFRVAAPSLCALLERFSATTAIVVPFVVMGEPIAWATFVYGPESGRRHTTADLAVADEVVRRAAQIVENARLHAAVAEALAYRERVIGILGHDLRNPVAAVLSLSTTLARRADVSERTKEGLLHMHAAAARMNTMIATLLDFTRLRFKGDLELSRDRFDLGALVRSIVDELLAADPRSNLTVEASGDLLGHWDASRLGQVISNLASNALAHGTRGGSVRLELSSAGDDVVLAVSNGGTIPRATLDRLFEPFWQGSETNRSRGLGLGLWIARQIVDAHGGDITVRSDDDLTTFRVRLPR